MAKLRSLKQIRKRIRRYRSGEHPLTWTHICTILEIFTDDGQPNTGLAEDIAFKVVNFYGEERDYYPSPDIARRLKIQPRCLGCMRPLRDETQEHVHRHVEAWQEWWKKQSASKKSDWIKMLYLYSETNDNPFE